MSSGPRTPQVALVTGGSNGIGKATALVFAEHGYDVALTYFSDREAARRVVEQIVALGKRCEASYLDLGQPSSTDAVVSSFRASFGRIDVLVNNAAVDYRRPLLHDTLEAWERVLRADLLGPVVAAQTAARIMIADEVKGAIINVTSVVDQLPVLGGGPYCSAKAALAAATNVMALELAPHGIRVNAVAPGFTATPQNFGPDEIDPRAGDYPEIPVGRPASPREIALAIAFLASDQASYLTGSRLLVDGGLLLSNGVKRFEDAVADRPEPPPL